MTLSKRPSCHGALGTLLWRPATCSLGAGPRASGGAAQPTGTLTPAFCPWWEGGGGLRGHSTSLAQEAFLPLGFAQTADGKTGRGKKRGDLSRLFEA